MRQKQRLRHKAQRCKKHPRSRQGWVLLHPMFPMKLSEYCGKCWVLNVRLQERAKRQKYRSLQSQIRRKLKDFPNSTQLWDAVIKKINRRVRGERKTI